jgi:hypothetical protein
MYSRTIHRLLIGLVGVAAAALFVPSLGLGAMVRDDVSGGYVRATSVSPVVSQIRPDNRAGELGAMPISASAAYSASDDVFSRAVARHEASQSATTSVRPDDRTGPLGAQPMVADYSTSTASSLRPDDRTGPLGAQPITGDSGSTVASLPATSVSNDGFRWLDAAIGAASMLAIFGLALVALTLQRQHRRVVAH